MSNISRSKGHQALKFGHVIEDYYLLNRNEAARLVQDLFLFFKKALYKVNTDGQHLSLNFVRPIKTNFVTFQTVDLEIYSILIFY